METPRGKFQCAKMRSAEGSYKSNFWTHPFSVFTLDTEIVRIEMRFFI